MSATDPSSGAVDTANPSGTAIVDACALHHESEAAGAHVRIVRIADTLASALDGELDLERCKGLGLDDATARKLCDQLWSELAKERKN